MLTTFLAASAISFSIALAPLPAAAADTATTPDSATAPAGARTVLAERFGDPGIGPGRAWGWQSAAYANCTYNPNSWKHDRLSRSALSDQQGHLRFTATHREDGDWDTGLLTTGDSCDSGGSGFQVHAGDLVLVHVRLPEADSGAWPCLWTWRDGGNEVDLFEWYADHPDRIEFVNHVRSGSTVYSDENVGAGRWIYVAVRLGADNDTWYVGPTEDRLTEVWSDGTGVGADFAAYLILNLSISDGSFHLPPASTAPVTMDVDLLTVERPTLHQRNSAGGVLAGSTASSRTRLPQTTSR
ncbi:beta-glucanase [Kitasatospora sp. NPDC049285]|uniref:beta-glucanase n=1 Tax=Kitasatospora sp. NPDC049285 TaxID=3157096 RepID=UPI0034424B33